MKRIILMTLGAFLICAAPKPAQAEFLFGVWTNHLPELEGTDLNSYCAMLHDTLKFNAIFGQCYTQAYNDLYDDHGIRVFVMANWPDHDFTAHFDTTNAKDWPWIYSEAAYSIFEAEGDNIGTCNPVYLAGQEVTIEDSIGARYFDHTLYDTAMIVQRGPTFESYPGTIGYGQIMKHHAVHTVDLDTTPVYSVTMRYRVGSDPTPLINDTIAVLYVERYQSPPVPWQQDEYLTVGQLCVVMDSDAPSVGHFGWSEDLAYNWKMQPGDLERYIDGVEYKVRWFANRDLYIDKLKVSEQRGRDLWEASQAETRLSGFVDRYGYDGSPTIAGFYTFDDRNIKNDLDNVRSARRVDSLIAFHSGKPGAMVPAAVTDYLAPAVYSDYHFQEYPIKSHVTDSSEIGCPTGLQCAWDKLTSDIGGMKQLALQHNKKCFVHVQGFSYHEPPADRSPEELEDLTNLQGNWKIPTLQENLCQVNLALSFGVDGIIYWKYDAVVRQWETFPAFLETGNEGGERTDVWGHVATTIGPHVSKLAPTLDNLTWKGSWHWNFDQTAGCQIDSIKDSITNYLSLSHLQVARFEGSDSCEEYYFIVNRRCQPEESYVGTVWFDALLCTVDKNIIRYEITDIEADSTFLGGRNQFDEYSFSISLEPGEGKLYRIRECKHCPGCIFGDADGSGTITISDAVFIINYMFAGGPAPSPIQSGDADCSGMTNISDAVYLINFIYSGGPAPCVSSC